MQSIILVQLGTGGMAWLVFTIGMLWCCFAWWRTEKNRYALASVISTIIALIAGLVMVTLLVTFSMTVTRSGSIDGELIQAIALGCFLLLGFSWAASATCFLLSAMKNIYPDLSQPSLHPPTSPHT